MYRFEYIPNTDEIVESVVTFEIKDDDIEAYDLLEQFVYFMLAVTFSPKSVGKVVREIADKYPDDDHND